MPKATREKSAGSGQALAAVLIALVVLAALGAAGLVVRGVYVGRARKLEAERKDAESLRLGTVRVRVARVKRIDLKHTVEATGTPRSVRSVKVMPEIPGKIERFTAEKGKPVEAGELVAALEASTLRAQVRAAEAAVSVARAAIKQAEVGVENANRELSRARALSNDGSISQRDLDAAETGLKSAEAGKALVSSQLEQATASLELAKLQLGKAEIRAPFAGLVADDYDRTPGQMVGPSVPLVEIIDMSRLVVKTAVPERELPLVRPGQTAEIGVTPLPSRVFEGTVKVAGPAVDPVTRAASVEIELRNVKEAGEYILRPGMFARVSILVGTRRGVLVVPESALAGEEGSYGAFVTEPIEGEEGLFELRRKDVVPGLRSRGLVEIREGLKEGDRVVSEAVSSVSSGLKVTVEEQ